MIGQRNNDRGAEGNARSLVVVARDATGRIVTRITSQYELAGATQTARCVLKLKVDAACVEVHVDEGPTSDYREHPLAAIRKDELVATLESSHR